MQLSVPVVRRALCAAVLIVLGVAGCGCSPALDPAAKIGTGDQTFEALVDGGEILIVQGGQGGYHFFGSMIAQGIEPGDRTDLQSPLNPTTVFRVFRGATRVDAMASSYTQGLRPSSARGTYEMIGRLVILDIANDLELDGVEVRFEVEITDVNGVVVRDERTLIARPHPNNA